MNLKEYIKKHPMLEKYARQLLNKRKKRLIESVKIIRGVKNRIKVDRSVFMNNCKFRINGNDNEIEILEKGSFNKVTFYIKGNNNKIFIAPGVKFRNGGSIWIEDYDCVVTIGEDSTFQKVHIAVTEPKSRIDIGKDCMFAYDIDLRTGDSHSIINTITNERINPAQNIVIGNHVWVASHVSILKGVTIQDNSIIATRALVSKPFDTGNILIGGIPAKKLKGNVTWSRERF